MQQTTWSSKLSFLIAATGAAVGLGSIWMFPYMAGRHGGSAFVLVYLGAMIGIGVPMLSAEIVIGRLGGNNVIDSMRQLTAQYTTHKHWHLIGYLSASTLIIILGFYSVLAGWSLAYMLKILSGNLHPSNIAASKQIWNLFSTNNILQITWHSVFMIITMITVACGIKKGIERISNIMMPGLVIILVILLIYGITNGDFNQAVHFLFYPDFTKLTPNIIMQAVGQACFSLAVGAGCMLVYGCYLPKNSDIISSSFIIAAAVLVISLLAGLAIFPLVFAYGLAVDSSFGLMFQVLPIAFSQMPFGIPFGFLFFLLLFFAALTSSISLAEPLVLLIYEKCSSCSRAKAAIIVGLFAWILGVAAILEPQIFNIFIVTVSNVLLPIGGIAFTIFAGLVLNSTVVRAALPIKNQLAFRIWRLFTGYLAPITLGIIMLYSFRL
ncbi:MAG: sodium-dependent transporter [Legionellales bacterium]|nr:MAG: sodium-dependent transporter [Legionellales bacterium]